MPVHHRNLRANFVYQGSCVKVKVTAKQRELSSRHHSAQFHCNCSHRKSISVIQSMTLPWYMRWELPVRSSGVTRVGDTRGRNWGCHPSIFFWENWRPFLFFSHHRLCQFYGVTPVYVLLFCSAVTFYWFHSGSHTFFTCPTSFLHYSL